MSGGIPSAAAPSERQAAGKGGPPPLRVFAGVLLLLLLLLLLLNGNLSLTDCRISLFLFHWAEDLEIKHITTPTQLPRHLKHTTSD
jgi:hypothetical protein